MPWFIYDTLGQLKTTIDTPIQLGSDTSYINISADGELTLVGDATVWDDIRIPVTAVQAQGTNDPDFTQLKTDGSGSTGVFSWQFDKILEQELFFEIQLPHTWKEGSTIKPHVHWCPIDTDTGVVQWGLEYTWANIGAVFGDTTIITGSEAAGGTAFYHHLTPIGSGIDATGKTLSSMLLCRVFRDATNVADTYDNDVAMFEIDVHFEIDKLGQAAEPGT